MQYDWLSHWEKDDIAFHQLKVNPYLEKFWQKLEISSTANVFVPLCGKTLDMLWLANQGHHVVGVELSDIACQAFFTENNLAFSVEKLPQFTRYHNNQIEIFCGDLFSLSLQMLPTIHAVYDRAALIALPENLRQRYANHIAQLLAKASKMLLIVYDSLDIAQGPPFAVPRAEVNRLYGDFFTIKELASTKKIELPEHLRKKGYHEIVEFVYKLTN